VRGERAGMPADMTIRAATAADAAVLAAFRVELGRAHGLDDPALEGGYLERCRAFFAGGLATGTVLAWLAFAGDRPVGSAVLELRVTLPRPRSPSAPTVDGRVRSVIVVPEHRRRGIATALMREVIGAAEHAAVDRLTLGASEMGEGLYAALGFVPRPREMEFRPAPGRGQPGP